MKSYYAVVLGLLTALVGGVPRAVAAPLLGVATEAEPLIEISGIALGILDPVPAITGEETFATVTTGASFSATGLTLPAASDLSFLLTGSVSGSAFGTDVTLSLTDLSVPAPILTGELIDFAADVDTLELLFRPTGGSASVDFADGILAIFAGSVDDFFTDAVFTASPTAPSAPPLTGSLTVAAVAAPIPVPAALPLFLSGFAGLLVLRRRREH